MSKLDELRQQVADMFKDATEKETIEKLAALNNSIDEVTQEQKSLMDKNAELIESYKTLVKHTSFKDDKKPGDTVTGVQSITFEEALDNFLANNK